MRLLLLSCLLACADRAPTTGRPAVAKQDGTKTSEAAEHWTSNDSPDIFSSGLVYELTKLPSQGAAEHAPWASSYWPVAGDSINYRWDGSNESAAAKYGRAFSISGVEDAVSRYHGIDSSNGKACTAASQCDASLGETCAMREGKADGRCIPTWFGICHAWAPAAIMLPEPKYPVTMNGVTFKVNDIKALVTLAHDRTTSEFVSGRCDTAGSDISGRPSEDCRDTNPGTMHLLLTNYLGLRRQAFVYDRTWDYEVWNQPLRAFRVTTYREVSSSEAATLVAEATYSFNANAVKLVYLETEVDYISESSPEVDGSLAATLDHYTRTDHYQYVLELDGGGKIIGGEWVGASKRAHPDFLWLPTGIGSATVAGGTISWARVKTLLDQSQLPPAANPGAVSVTKPVTLAQGQWQHFGPFAAAKGLVAEISGDGDADLYVRKGAVPTKSAYDCRPFQEGSNERCEVSSGPIYVSVYAASAATVSVHITYEEGDPGIVPPASTQHLNVGAAVNVGDWMLYTVNVEAGKAIRVATTSAVDVDLYVRMDLDPTGENFFARGWGSTGNEAITLTPVSSGVLHIGVYGYASGDFKLVTSDQL